MYKESEINSKRTLPTYTRLRGVSWYAHQLAQRPEEANEQLSNCMTFMLFSAFCIEAYLNHIGQETISFWDILKKSLSPYETLDVLADVLVFTPEFGCRPYQTFRSIFKLRNLLVHAKTETIMDEGELF
ncbi:MAG: hypothetical protein MUO77_20565, partial [Anaerolineales bacterium]|nr:hypothetical protein [Anaerolineales bacterium]